MRYYIENKEVLFPKINRSQNIGDKEGLFNPSAQWHKNTIYNNSWVGNQFYKDYSLNKKKFFVK